MPSTVLVNHKYIRYIPKLAIQQTILKHQSGGSRTAVVEAVQRYTRTLPWMHEISTEVQLLLLHDPLHTRSNIDRTQTSKHTCIK
jgi:hypothetical protein